MEKKLVAYNICCFGSRENAGLKVEDYGWTLLPLFHSGADQGEYIRTGQHQLPLFSKNPTKAILDKFQVIEDGKLLATLEGMVKAKELTLLKGQTLVGKTLPMFYFLFSKNLTVRLPVFCFRSLSR